MKLEEIRDSVNTGLSDRDWTEFEVLESRLNDAIAERALPVTREWLDTMGTTFNVGQQEYWLIGQDLKHVMVSLDGANADCCVVWHCVGSSVGTVKNVGQLLDLLSGLGVTK